VDDRKEIASVTENNGRHSGLARREWWYPRLIVAGIVALGGVGLWTYQHRNDTLRTQRLEIVDARGRVCAVLGSLSGGQSGLTLTGVSGEARATLTVNRDGNPALMLCNSDGMQRAGLEISPKGQSVLRLLNDSGEVRAAVQVDKEGKSVVKVTGMNGKSEASLTYDGGHSSDVRVRNGRSHFDANYSPAQAAVGKPKPGVRVSLLSDDPNGEDERLRHHTAPVAN
jgi:hypothetical protein